MPRAVVELSLILLIGAVVCATMSPTYIPGFVAAVPVLLGIVLAAMISLLAIVAALSSPTDLASLAGREAADDVERYQEFIRSAKADLGYVFWGTVGSIAFYVLAGIPTPLAADHWFHDVAIRAPVFFAMVALGLSVDATWDILQSLFLLQEERYRLFKKRQEERAGKEHRD